MFSVHMKRIIIYLIPVHSIVLFVGKRNVVVKELFSFHVATYEVPMSLSGLYKTDEFCGAV